MNNGQELHVVFGAGPLGQATAAALLRRGHRVRVVNRSGQGTVPAGSELVTGDAYNAAQVRTLCTGATAVYQCAQPAYDQWTTKFMPLQTAIIEGVAPTGAKLIAGENLYMYGQVDGPIHADLPYAAHTRKGRVRAQMAEQLQAAHHSGKLRTASARGSDFFGPGVRGSTLGERVFEAALAGKAAQAIGRLDVPHSYTFIDDFGEALAILGERDAGLGRAWHVPTAPPLTQGELIERIYRELGRKPQIRTMGRLMMRIGGLFIPEARETVEMLYEFEAPFVVDSSRFEQTFGMQPTPIDTALERTIAWYRAQSVERVAA